MDYIIIIISLTPPRLNFFKFWQLSTIRRIVFPLNTCGKENISLTARVLIVVLITVHYTYNCIKLMHNKEVFYTHFAVLLTLSSQQCKQCTYHATMRCIYTTIVAAEEQ